MLVIVCSLSYGAAQLGAAEYFRWIDETGVLHITDNLHNVPPAQRGNAGRTQVQEAPRPPENQVKEPQRRASVPMERHGQVVVIQATLNNKRSAKFVVDTGASYTLISNALARDLSIDVSANPKTLPFQTANGLIQAPVTNFESIAVGGMEIRNLTGCSSRRTARSRSRGVIGVQFFEQLSNGHRHAKGRASSRKKIIEPR